MPAADGLVEMVDATDVRACHALMLQLRPQLGTADEWLLRFQRQATTGYRLLALLHGGQAVALAGFRVQENLVYGRFLYVDDLVTHAAERGGGHAAQLLHGLQAEARRQGCERLVLDTALGNVQAHRFYYRSGLVIQALRFGMPVTAAL
ncbi:MAG: GNAT family N-acetyltransferase [Rhodoferax sp.]|uniref:GNAT family N-acetyltransferase n=1 Tax=Rhodoferax sp. TaxID=50421 RepID=UPI003266FACC